MTQDIVREVRGLKKMTVTALRQRYSVVFGEECRSFHIRERI